MPGPTDGTDPNNAAYRWLAWSGVALQAVALVAVLFLQRWNGAWSLSIFLILSVAFLLTRDRLPSLFNLVVVVAALLNAAGWAFNVFQQVGFWDEFVHAFTSFAVVAAVTYLYWQQRTSAGLELTATRVLVIVLVGLALGAAWEIAEAIFINLTLTDTLVDLVMDAIGAALAAPFAAWGINRRRASLGFPGESPRRSG